MSIVFCKYSRLLNLSSLKDVSWLKANITFTDVVFKYANIIHKTSTIGGEKGEETCIVEIFLYSIWDICLSLRKPLRKVYKDI